MVAAYSCFLVHRVNLFRSYDKEKDLSLEWCIMQSVISVFSLGNDLMISSCPMQMTEKFVLHSDSCHFSDFMLRQCMLS